MLIVISLIVKKVLEVEVKSGFRDKGRVHTGGHLLSESNFDWPVMGTRYYRLKACPLGVGIMYCLHLMKNQCD